MREVAHLLGWCGPDGEPEPADLLRVRRRLRRVERQLSKRLVFGGGDGGSARGGGGRLWTTINALRTAGLLDDWPDMTQAIKRRLDEQQELVELLDERQRGLAKSLGALFSQLGVLARKLGVKLQR